jgi:iron complex transport system ATP-binding protein
MDIADLVDKPFNQLSTGEQARALLARAVVAQPELLILDEPTVGLDIGARAAVIGALDAILARPDPPTLITVSHHLDEMPAAIDQVILLKAGRIHDQGPPDAVLTSDKLSRTFDCPVTVINNDGRYLASAKPEPKSL